MSCDSIYLEKLEIQSGATLHNDVHSNFHESLTL